MKQNTKSLHIFSATIALMALTGCASFDGTAKPVISLKSALDHAKAYNEDAAITFLAGTNDEVTRRVYRNRVIMINMAAIDARYFEFRTNLAREIKGSNFGLDTAFLALTGVAALSGKSTANILSASAAGLTGTKSALSKDVYLERTLPAILTSMETARLKVRTDIVQKMKNASTAEYGVEEAFLDLSNYQMMSSIDSAVEQLKSDATQQRVEQERKYNVVFEACDATEAVGLAWAQIGAALNSVSDPAKLKALSSFTGAAPSDDVNIQREAIRDTLNSKYCTESSANSLLAEISR
jgi:hypothetical protein